MSATPTCRNLQKKAKKARYEREKAYMDSIRGLGIVTGDYVGDGQGDSVSTSYATEVPLLPLLSE